MAEPSYLSLFLNPINCRTITVIDCFKPKVSGCQVRGVRKGSDKECSYRNPPNNQTGIYITYITRTNQTGINFTRINRRR